MIISIASGKGGTGKTTFAVNLAYFLSEKQQVALLDCDVEEPNDHLFLNVEKYNQRPVAVPHPIFEKAKCNGCGKCVEVCNFNALAIAKDVPMIFNELCHSCGACGYLCPEMAISETQYQIGSIFQPFNNVLPFDFAYGLLNIGEVLAPEIIKQLKKGHLRSEYTNIIDASPGIGCTVVESLDKAGAAVLITEPTPFGLHDLELALELTRKMQIPAGIVINRSDGVDKIIANFAEKAKIPLLGRIPFDRKYAEAYSKGEVLIKRFPEFRKQISLIYQNILLLEKMEISPNQYEGETYYECIPEAITGHPVPGGPSPRISERESAFAIPHAEERTAETSLPEFSSPTPNSACTIVPFSVDETSNFPLVQSCTVIASTGQRCLHNPHPSHKEAST